LETLQYNPDAIWISHSALEEFYRCPKSYFFRYIYTNSNGMRITLADPNLTLGVLVDDTIKYYYQKKGQVGLQDLFWYLDFKWKIKTGKSGGFISSDQEQIYKEKGRRFLVNFYENIAKLNLNPEVPKFLEMSLFNDKDVRLCGSPDLIDTLPDGSLHVIDFKTSEKEAEATTLQLPIYTLLIENVLGKKVSKTSYWYLNVHDRPVEVSLAPKDYLEEIKFRTQPILLAREAKDFRCNRGADGCFKCSDYDYVKKGVAEIVGKDKKRVVYFVDRSQPQESLYSTDLPF